MKRTMLILLLTLVASPGDSAAPQERRTPTPDEHRAKYNYTRVQPLLDVPMIDAAITKGPDGQYYLTGTLGTKRSDGTLNFAVNDGISLWRSKDLKSWESLGKVVDRSVVNAKVEELGLLRTASDPDEMKGLLAPELHFIQGACFLTYSLKPCGTGLLKSTTGNPEGPYEDVGLIGSAIFTTTIRRTGGGHGKSRR